jgi:hypothetical protein
MRRLVLVTMLLALASTAGAATPYFLDRSGQLWQASATSRGLVLTAHRGAEQVVESTVPFTIGVPGSYDAEIRVAADELTGKVAVVWQRNWSEHASEIIAAIWDGGNWEQVVHLNESFSDRPRSPAVRVSEHATTVPDPDDPEQTVVLRESFLHISWWEGVGEGGHARYALLRLDAEVDDPDRLLIRDLDRVLGIPPCEEGAAPEAIEHPTFAAGGVRDRNLLLYGTSRDCLLYLLEVAFELEEAETPAPELTVTAQRRRSRPVFGVRKAFPAERDLDLAGARMLVGRDLNPVAYRIREGRLEYAVATAEGWSEIRELPLSDTLTLDQAIPLVESLAR